MGSRGPLPRWRVKGVGTSPWGSCKACEPRRMGFVVARIHGTVLHFFQLMPLHSKQTDQCFSAVHPPLCEESTGGACSRRTRNTQSTACHCPWTRSANHAAAVPTASALFVLPSFGLTSSKELTPSTAPATLGPALQIVDLASDLRLPPFCQLSQPFLRVPCCLRQDTA